ncbi:putative lipoprotein [Leptospira kirschneri str. 200803703]|nr:putative lipoprotein [Leptospira kirschneri str. 200803703]
MKKIIYCLLILGFLTSCKECKPGQNEPEVSLEVDGIYGVYETRILYTLAKSDISFDYKAVCIEIQKPDVFVVRFLNTEKKKDIHMKWEKAEEGKYKINYKDQTAFSMITKHTKIRNILI